MRRVFLVLLSVVWVQLSGQDVISLSNPSFEDTPHRGRYHSDMIRGWYDCGRSLFPSETPPDIHPTMDRAWQVTKSAIDDYTYLGMVVRANDSWESVSQAISSPLEAGACYDFSIYLSRSNVYLSSTRWADTLESFTQPIVLRIWGGSSFCDRDELLAESPTVENREWKLYPFRFEPQQDHRFIVLEAFYKTPTPFPYNGNVLLDGASDIVKVSCSSETDLADLLEDREINKSPVPDEKGIAEADPERSSKKPAELPKPPPQPEKADPPEVVPEVKILQELDREKIVEGQTIRIENLYFKADSSRITEESYPVLQEISAFLLKNPDVIIEIGGHTNTVPSHEYCDALSADRAQAVMDYLIDKGVPRDQLFFKGYGKRRPLVPNDRYSKLLRQKNQRVELKVLSMNG